MNNAPPTITKGSARLTFKSPPPVGKCKLKMMAIDTSIGTSTPSHEEMAVPVCTVVSFPSFGLINVAESF